MRLGGCPQTGALALGPARAAPCFHMEDRDLVLMVPAMDTDLVPAMATEAATLGAVEVAGPKDPDPEPDPDTEPVPPVADLWSLPASATVRAKTPKWRIG